MTIPRMYTCIDVILMHMCMQSLHEATHIWVAMMSVELYVLYLILRSAYNDYTVLMHHKKVCITNFSALKYAH